MRLRFLVIVLPRKPQVVRDTRGLIDRRFPKRRRLLLPDNVSLTIDHLLRRPQMIILIVEEAGFCLPLPRGLDPHRISPP